jgi:site-specific recombinase XerD
MSVKLRRMLYRWCAKHTGDRVFGARDGGRLKHRNALRQHYLLLTAAGVSKCGFHRLRHTFATSYLRHGGEVVRLSRILGHSELDTTMKYVHMLTGDLQQPHQQLSVLNRLRSV